MIPGDIEDCLVAPVAQGQFTPLPEALCWAILELTSQRQAATLDTLRSALKNAFPAMQRPSRDLVYDALAKLMQERKIYHTAQGYFVVTPETRRLRRESSSQRRGNRDITTTGRSQPGMLMSNDEAMALVHGEMVTLRDGDVTHQAVQTNLADVICGGEWIYEYSWALLHICTGAGCIFTVADRAEIGFIICCCSSFFLFDLSVMLYGAAPRVLFIFVGRSRNCKRIKGLRVQIFF